MPFKLLSLNKYIPEPWLSETTLQNGPCVNNTSFPVLSAKSHLITVDKCYSTEFPHRSKAVFFKIVKILASEKPVQKALKRSCISLKLFINFLTLKYLAAVCIIIPQCTVWPGESGTQSNTGHVREKKKKFHRNSNDFGRYQEKIILS